MKYNNFIQKSDLTSLFDTKYLDQITSTDDQIWKRIESQELERLAGYTRHWYDMNHELRAVVDHSDAVIYPINQRVVKGDIVYTAIKEVPAGTPVENKEYWGDDDRNATIVQIACYLVLYALSGRLGTKIHPQLAADRHQIAMDDLVRLQKGSVMLDMKRNELPEDTDEGEYSGHSINYGYNENSINDYGY